MSVTDDDIRDYREYNSLADDITCIKSVKAVISPGEYKRIAKLNSDIAKKEAKMGHIAGLLSARLGPEWASRCVESIIREPGYVSVSVESGEFSGKSGHIGIEDINGVKFIVGSECFEIRRVER